MAQYRAPIIQASHEDEFCAQVDRLLAELNPHAATLFGPRPKGDAALSINATFRAVHTKDGRRWMFQDVPRTGAAAKAGVLPGDVLAFIGKRFVGPPHIPKFCLGQKVDLRVSREGLTRSLRIEIDVRWPQPWAADFLFLPGMPVSFAENRDSQTGYLRVPSFYGQYGTQFARRLRREMVSTLKGVDRLVIDLRGNPGGGRGALRLMSYLTPSRIPVGYTVDRELAAEREGAKEPLDASRVPPLAKVPSIWFLPFSALGLAKKRSMVLETEGLGPQKFHGKTVILVNEHSRGAAEMVAKFAQEKNLATVVGTRTPGQFLPRRTFGIKIVGIGIVNTYRLALPVADYISWSGQHVEGVGVQPGELVDWCSESARAGRDAQYERAIEIARSL